MSPLPPPSTFDRREIISIWGLPEAKNFQNWYSRLKWGCRWYPTATSLSSTLQASTLCERIRTIDTKGYLYTIGGYKVYQVTTVHKLDACSVEK